MSGDLFKGGTMKDAELATLRKLHAAAVETQAKVNEIIEEMGRVLGGEAGIGALLKVGEQMFETAWNTRYPGRYVWRYSTDRPQMKRLIKMLGVNEIGTRAQVYLQNADPFYLKARHNFGLFVSSINSHATISHEPVELTLVPDCKHKPRCPTEAFHTRRSAAELRQ